MEETSIKGRHLKKEFRGESVDFYRGATTAMLAVALGFLAIHFASDGAASGSLASGQALLVIAVILYAYTFLLMRIVKKRALVENRED